MAPRAIHNGRARLLPSRVPATKPGSPGGSPCPFPGQPLNRCPTTAPRAPPRALRQRLVVDPHIRQINQHRETVRRAGLQDLGIARAQHGRLAELAARITHPAGRLAKLRVIEPPRDSQRRRQVILPDPQGIDPLHHRDRLDLGDAPGRLDLRDDEHLIIGRLHGLTQVAGPVIVVRHAEGHAPPARRRISRRVRQRSRLVRVRHHRHHHPHRTNVQHPRDEVILHRRHPYHWHKLRRPRRRHQHPDRLHVPSGVLPVEHRELRPRRRRDPADPRRAELHHHRPDRYAPAARTRLTGFLRIATRPHARELRECPTTLPALPPAPGLSGDRQPRPLNGSRVRPTQKKFA